ncbi:MAG TPA: hypothetical protein VIW29_16860 [Polyangiaceae bacterium]
MSSWHRLPLIGLGVSCAGGCAAATVDEEPESPGASRGGGSSSATAGGSSAGKSTSSSGGSVAGSAGHAGGGSSGSSGSGGSGGRAGSGGSAGSGGRGGSGGSGGSAGQPPGPVSTDLPFTEDFEDGEANGFLPWNEDLAAGPWQVLADGAGKIYQPQAPVAELEFAVGGSTSWTDVALKVKVRLADDQSAVQLLLRMKDPKTYLVVEMAEGKYKLRARADGSTQDLVAPSPKPVIVAGTWYTVGVAAKGSAVTLTLDDAVIGTASAPAAISNGGIAVGVAEGSAAFDDVLVVAAP